MMQRRSLAEVKAHLSEVVDQAEHQGKRIIILRHGKPAAAIVPVESLREATKPRRMSRQEAERRLDELARDLGSGSSFSAVADILEGRR